MATIPVNLLAAALRRAVGDLDALGCHWALIGGLAVGARAQPRTTRDVDLAVQVKDDTDAESLIYNLQTSGYRVIAVLEQVPSGRLATVRLLPPIEGSFEVLVDLLFNSCGVEPEIVKSAEIIPVLKAIKTPVARIGHLLALKVLARDDIRRPQDWDDIQALLREANQTDLDEARTALKLIMQRGYHRDKDLIAEFERCLEERALLPGKSFRQVQWPRK